MNILQKFFSGILLMVLLSGCSQKAGETGNHQRQSDSLIITNAWARPAAEGTNSAAYMTIHNHTSKPDTLIGVFGTAVTLAEIHESYEEGGMVGMHPAHEQVIAPESQLELKPGRLHIMLIQVKKQLIVGDSLQLNLEFTGAGTKQVTVPVQ